MSHHGNDELRARLYEDLWEELGREPTHEEVEDRTEAYVSSYDG